MTVESSSTSTPLFIVILGVSSSTGIIKIEIISDTSCSPSDTDISNLSSVVSVSSCWYIMSVPVATSARLKLLISTGSSPTFCI
uniref:Uncharacterized protein n=1 Tax=Ciona intestinalis TaxID=7719 RepID=H2XQZ8_CIOIN